jgi:DNA-binding CsgD family transcriptional regulator
MGWRTVALLLRGRWTEAEELCAAMQTKQGISPINLLNPIRVLGTIKGRRGDGEGWELLDQAATLGEATCEPQWIVPVRAARAELMWLANGPDLALGEARTGYEQGVGRVDPWTLAPAAIWLGRLEGRAAIRVDLPEPYALELAGRHGEAADAFEEIGQIYDAAMVRLHDTDEGALRQAASTFDDLGARVAATQVRRRMKELGIGNIPRGPRSGTRDAPAGLTAREQEVLALLTEGLSDREISRRLVISDRTVHHHVSAILSKIGVTSRSAAVVKAARMGIGTPI